MGAFFNPPTCSAVAWGPGIESGSLTLRTSLDAGDNIVKYNWSKEAGLNLFKVL